MEGGKEEGLAVARHNRDSNRGHAKGAASVASESRAVPTGVGENGNSSINGSQIEFEAKSAIDGAWFDVDFFISSRMSESGEQELMAKFSWFGVKESEWVNARTYVRRRSIPLKASECELVKIGHHVLCYKETQQSGLYFDAEVLARKEKAHGEGCDCTFLMRFDRDQSEETVRLRKLCYRPETYELSK